MKLYIDYVNKYEGAIQTIDKYKAQNAYFVNFLRVRTLVSILWCSTWHFLIRKQAKILKVNAEELEIS